MTDVDPETDVERFNVDAARRSHYAACDLLAACDEIERLHSLLLRAEEERDAARDYVAQLRRARREGVG